MPRRRRAVTPRVAAAAVALVALYAGASYARVKQTLAAAHLPEIPLGAERQYGDPAAPPYRIVVAGDSTAHGIGADSVDESFGARVAQSLAHSDRRVSFTNLGVTGARAEDVLHAQLPNVAALQPDLILLSIGANDVTNWTGEDAYLQKMRTMIDALSDTGATVAVLDVPAIVSVPLLPLPVRLLFDVRTHRFNDGPHRLIADQQTLDVHNKVILVPIYEETRPIFERDHTNFAADGFHPSSKGYAVWADVILRALRVGGITTPDGASPR